MGCLDSKTIEETSIENKKILGNDDNVCLINKIIDDGKDINSLNDNHHLNNSRKSLDDNKYELNKKGKELTTNSKSRLIYKESVILDPNLQIEEMFDRDKNKENSENNDDLIGNSFSSKKAKE